jgi:hypothetical protein
MTQTDYTTIKLSNDEWLLILQALQYSAEDLAPHGSDIDDEELTDEWEYVSNLDCLADKIVEQLDSYTPWV